MLRRSPRSDSAEPSGRTAAQLPSPSETPASATDVLGEPRYSRPKVLLIDLPDEAVTRVRVAGYRVDVGSLGRPQTIRQKRRPGEYLPVAPNGHLPGFAEQEVIVVQHRPSQPVDLNADDVAALPDSSPIWVSPDESMIDSRPLAAQHFRANAQRILDHGGVFIVFCEPRVTAGLVAGNADFGRSSLRIEAALDWTVWDLVPELDSFRVTRDHGEEIAPAMLDAFDVLVPHLTAATFDCTLSPSSRHEFLPLACNKYGATVAGVLATQPEEQPDGSTARGFVFLLPQVQDIGVCVAALLDDVLPRLAPKLFPESSRTAWVNEGAYELPAIKKLQREAEVVRREADIRETELQAAIEKQREKDGWLHTLFTGTDDELEHAVKDALTALGLRDGRKVDSEQAKKRNGRLREDLQVWGEGETPIVLVEVKGIHGLPKENNALQVTKYLHPRMREWGRTDIRGLAVINQQRGLPALERENVQTFQDDVLVNAQEQEFGLITTIDLFRLARNKRLWEWPDETVAPLLYGNGRILPIPRHYDKVGVIDGYFEQPGVVIITVTDAPVAVGDKLAFVLPIDYEEQMVDSIHLDDGSVQEAAVGSRVGIKTSLTKAQARSGVEVFRLRPVAQNQPE